MDLRQLAALSAVAEHGTFSAAAAALHTVQSNVSAHVARLEKELGTTLVDRSAGRLTDEGRAVVNRARRIQAELDALVADVTALGAEVQGTVRLGVVGTTGRWLVPRLLPRMEERHPGVSVTVVDATSTSLDPLLGSGLLDLAVVTLPVPGPELTATPLFEEDFVLVVPEDHPLAGRNVIEIPDLAGLDLLLPPRGTNFRSTLDGACTAAGFALRARAELDGVRLLASLAFEGWAPAILPASAIPAWLQGPWRRVEIRGLPPRTIGLATRARGLLSAPARATGAVLAEVVWKDGAGQPGVRPAAP